MSNDPAIIKSFRVRTIKAPLGQRHKTASGTIEAAPLEIVDVQTTALEFPSAFS